MAVAAVTENQVGVIRILDRNGKQMLVFTEHTKSVRWGSGHLEFNPDGRLFFSQAANELKIWETDTGKVRWEADSRTLFSDSRNLESIYCWGGVAFSPDGRFVTIPSPEGMKIVSTANFREKSTVTGTAPAFFRYPYCFFSPDSRRLVLLDHPYSFSFSTAHDKPEKRQLKVWDVDASREVESTSFDRPWNFMSAPRVTFSPDSRYFAFGVAQGAVTIFDAATGKERTVVKLAFANPGGSPQVVFSSNGDRVVVLSSGGKSRTRNIELTVWETATGKLLFRLEEQAPVVVFSPDSKRIATSDRRAFALDDIGVIKLWDADNGRELLSLKHEQGFGSLSFSPDGHRLRLQTPDGQGQTWDATPRAETAKQP
jgi:WD40 repeat protein